MLSITFPFTVSEPIAFAVYPPEDGTVKVKVFVVSVHPVKIWFAMTLPVAVFVTMKLYVYGRDPPEMTYVSVSIWP